MDALIEIPRCRWPELRDKFLTRWPHGLPGYSTLCTQIQHPELADAYGVKVFCPYGDLESGVVAFNDKGGEMNEILVLTVSENTQKLEDALVESKLIFWSENPCVPWADCDVRKVLRRVEERQGMSLVAEAASIKLYRSKASEPYGNLVCPPNTYTAKLKKENVSQVDKAWPYRCATSPRFFELLIQCGLSYGLYSSEDHTLLAWVFVGETGFLTHLYCEEKHRKKGYAEYLMKFVSNDHIGQGKDVVCFIMEENSKSMMLFRKLDYDVIGRGMWMCCGPPVRQGGYVGWWGHI